MFPPDPVHNRLHILPPAAAVLSGVLLWSAFPPPAQSGHAWFALVPLIAAARLTGSPRQAFRLGWISGAVFWFLNLTWMWRLAGNGGPLPLVILGHAGLALYCALYTGMFAALLPRFQRFTADGGIARVLLRSLLCEPLLWVGAEFLRATLLTGFAWNFLGVSQYHLLPLIQVAEWTGVYGVSALIMMVNSGLSDLLLRLKPAASSPRPRRCPCGSPVLLAALGLLALCALWGNRRIRQLQGEASAWPTVRLTLVQPNAPSLFERASDTETQILEELWRQTRLAAPGRPDLIVWPETAVPGLFPVDRILMQALDDLSAEARTPILTGLVEIERLASTDGGDTADTTRFFNSAWLFDPANPGNPQVYRKQHLVPFGEYIPFDHHWPRLQRLSPIGYSCTPGRKATIMRIAVADGIPLAFSPLICFEDTLPYLSRRAVRAGARLLVNQTNDAWFDGSTEPLQHLAQAVFRSVETRTPMVRAANTGVSAFIQPDGRVDMLELDGRTTSFAGFRTQTIAVPPTPSATHYLRHGDFVLGIPAAAFLIAAGIAIFPVRKQRNLTNYTDSGAQT